MVGPRRRTADPARFSRRGDLSVHGPGQCAGSRRRLRARLSRVVGDGARRRPARGERAQPGEVERRSLHRSGAGAWHLSLDRFAATGRPALRGRPRDRALSLGQSLMNVLAGEWPSSPEQLVEVQQRLADEQPSFWQPGDRVRSAAGCFVCLPRGLKGKGGAGDPAWAAAASWTDGRLAALEVVRATAPASYLPGLLALREGPLLEAAVRRLPDLPEVLLVDATGRDHPRRAGLALHLGARLGVPTVGVTERPLDAEGVWPDEPRGSASPLRIGHEVVGYWLRVKAATRPLAVH